MQAKFEMSMIGELNHFLGLQIHQQESGIFLSQSKYAKNLVKKFGLESASFVRTIMSPNVKFTIDLLGTSVDSSLCRSMIVSLLYLTISRPDISYSVRMYARYQANSKESHMITLKRIIKYVKTIVDFGVWYSKDTNDVLVGYSDADWVGNANDRKSTLGSCFYVGNNLVSKMSKKQNFISLSIVEAEYIAIGNCCTQLLWMQKLLLDYGNREEHFIIYCDNTSAINISKNPVQHS
ncbi:secreted RxLR effector protein 161-like [Quercus suber]|uniref:secreted RxLR effector protein 161-like n=1 Tax=Quercus suber TaxID=58331 RepID=UPI0032E005FD